MLINSCICRFSLKGLQVFVEVQKPSPDGTVARRLV